MTAPIVMVGAGSATVSSAPEIVVKSPEFQEAHIGP